MLCPNCGADVSGQDQYCSACGKSLTGGEEAVLHSFGPFGVNVCFSRPGVFVWMQKNNTKIFVTNRRVCGASAHSLSDSMRFQVPFGAILAKEKFKFGLWTVVWVQYREGEKIKEVSIMCTTFNAHNIEKTYDLLEKLK